MMHQQFWYRSRYNNFPTIFNKHPSKQQQLLKQNLFAAAHYNANGRHCSDVSAFFNSCITYLSQHALTLDLLLTKIIETHHQRDETLPLTTAETTSAEKTAANKHALSTPTDILTGSESLDDL